MYRHTKNGKVQVVPLCSKMVSILREYMMIRKGEPEEYLFCNQYGEMLSENALRLAIAHYNRSRGVEKTSIHLFRHTFARKYLVDCGGDAFLLQKLMGHSTLAMTKHYCAIYDADISKNFDRFFSLGAITANQKQAQESMTEHLLSSLNIYKQMERCFHISPSFSISSSQSASSGSICLRISSPNSGSSA